MGGVGVWRIARSAARGVSVTTYYPYPQFSARCTTHGTTNHTTRHFSGPIFPIYIQMIYPWGLCLLWLLAMLLAAGWGVVRRSACRSKTQNLNIPIHCRCHVWLAKLKPRYAIQLSPGRPSLSAKAVALSRYESLASELESAASSTG